MPKIIEQNSVFIDPEECGSSVGYYVKTDEYKSKDAPTKHYVNATVVLTDCSHKIDWYFNNSDGGDLDKIDAAIEMLCEFRRKYNAKLRACNRLNKGE